MGIHNWWNNRKSQMSWSQKFVSDQWKFIVSDEDCCKMGHRAGNKEWLDKFMKYDSQYFFTAGHYGHQQWWCIKNDRCGMDIWSFRQKKAKAEKRVLAPRIGDKSNQCLYLNGLSLVYSWSNKFCNCPSVGKSTSQHLQQEILATYLLASQW